VPSQSRGIELVEQLRLNKIPYEDSLLASSSHTRLTVKRLQTLLEALSNPLSIAPLSAAFLAWGARDEPLEERRPWLDEAAALILKCSRVENYLWPGTAGDWLESLARQGAAEQNLLVLQEFRSYLQRWQAAVQLPIDQLVLTLSQDLFKTSAELALAHKLALLLNQSAGLHPEWRLPEMVDEIRSIARNERRFIGFSSEDSGFDPDQYRDTVVVSTFHKAKGLEWDRVYLLSVNNYDFPSGLEYDQYQGEKRYVRDHLNLTAEALAQLEAVLSVDEQTWYQEGQPSLNSRLDYARERLRLLYVGITRARRELVVTWNTGRYGDLRPALPLVALSSYWNEFRKEDGDENS
jgi:DNA helicase-2/ATP-dependent DNA helicase PcrA